MPIYEYHCSGCEQLFEEWQKGFEDKVIPCPVCGDPSRRIISQSSFVLKGGGWYVTDYAGKNGVSPAGKADDKPAAADAASAAPKGEASKTEAKAADSGGSGCACAAAG